MGKQPLWVVWSAGEVKLASYCGNCEGRTKSLTRYYLGKLGASITCKGRFLVHGVPSPRVDFETVISPLLKPLLEIWQG